MTHGSLFSGIGGFDLASEWMGWENIFHCEWNEFCSKVLKYHFPKSISYNDITKTDFTIHRGRIDVLSGGFPCQPFSLAGSRLGTEDSRHLWPEMLRAIKEIQPSWVVGENVYGLVNWSDGLVFHQIQTDLETNGYEVFPYVCPACAVNAPHRRDRIFFVAYRKHTGLEHSIKRGTKNEVFREEAQRGEDGTPFIFQPTSADGIRRDAPHPNGNGLNRCDAEYENNTSEGGVNALRQFGEMGGNVTDTGKQGLERQCREREGCSEYRSDKGVFIGSESEFNAKDTNTQRGQECNIPGEPNEQKQSNRSNYAIPTDWSKFPIESPICFGDDGLSSGLDNITFSKWRNQSIMAAGNAVVPQLVLQFFKTIQQYEALPRMADTL